MTPDAVPVLSSGRHRNPRKGACFMEMASFLAGEKWSDHPSCTHPLLAGLARMVNDVLPDSERGRIAPLIPDVVGLDGPSVEVDIAITVRAAAAAMPVAAGDRQNVMACALTTCERLLDDRGTSQPELRALIREARLSAPGATAWAKRYSSSDLVSERTFRRRTAPHIVRYAVDGLALACTDDAHDRLVALLADTIADVSTRCPDTTGLREEGDQAPEPARSTRSRVTTSA
ncbi:MAG: hypothetical protein ABI249_05515 [Ornithinibacter sp.]